MFKNVMAHFPSRLFVLSNILFWLMLNTLATDWSTRQRFAYEGKADFIDMWMMNLPYWGNWAVITPLILTLLGSMQIKSAPLAKFIMINLAVMLFSMTVYWGLTLIEVMLITSGTVFSYQALLYSFSELLVSPLHFDLSVYLAVTSMVLTFKYNQTIQHQAAHNHQLSTQLLNVELTALKSQLNPHFLFNTLNTISGLVRLDQKARAVKVLSELSRMFRGVLDNQPKQMTKLKHEIEFVESYLAIQKMRFENKIDMRLKIDQACLNVELPVMLLHTLVENAVQHGSQLESDANILHLVIAKQNEQLNIWLVNKACSNDNKEFGIGLSNCHKRLKYIYSEKYVLTGRKIANGHFETFLSLPIGGTGV